MKMVLVLVTILAAQVVLTFAGCDAVRDDKVCPIQETSYQPLQAATGFHLPSPERIEFDETKSLVSSGLVLTRSGRDYEATHAQRVSVVGTNVRFDPAWTASQPNTSDIAYAVYSFNLVGYAGAQTFQLTWATSGAEVSLRDCTNLWVGFSNWTSDRWEWRAGHTSGVIELEDGGYQHYIKPSTGTVFVAVVLLGDASAILQDVRVGSLRGDWWMYGHDTQHTHRSPYTGPKNPSLKWSFSTQGYPLSCPAANASKALYMGANHWLFSVDSTGEMPWHYLLPDYLERSSPAIGTDGSVYLGCVDGRLYAFNYDRTLAWYYETGDAVESSPAIGADGSVYVGSNDGNLYSLHPDGTLKWYYSTGGTVFSSPAIAPDGTILFGSADGNLYALTESGTLRWVCELGGNIWTSPAIASDGTVYIGGGISLGLCAVADDGTLKWHYQTANGIESGPAIGADGTVYVGGGKWLYAINPNGNPKWAFKIGQSGFGLPPSPSIGADGTIYIGSTDGTLYAIHPNGAKKWSYSTGTVWLSTTPVICSDGTIYIGSSNGTLYAIGPSSG